MKKGADTSLRDVIDVVNRNVWWTSGVDGFREIKEEERESCLA